MFVLSVRDADCVTVRYQTEHVSIWASIMLLKDTELDS